MRVSMNTRVFENCSFELDSFCYIVGANGCGKSRLLNVLGDGFSGKMKNQFLVNGNIVEKNEFDVIEIGMNDTFDIESALGSKSLLKTRVGYDLDALEQEKTDRIRQLIEDLENEIVSELSFDDFELKIQSSISLDLKGLVVKNLHFLYDDMEISDMSFTEKRLIYIQFILNWIKLLNRPYVLLIDEFDVGLGERAAKELLAKLEDFDVECIGSIIVTSSRIYNGSNYVLKENGLIHLHHLCDEVYETYALDNHEQLSDVIEYLNEQELEKWFREEQNYMRVVNRIMYEENK